MLLYGLGYTPGIRITSTGFKLPDAKTSEDPNRVSAPLTAYDKCLIAHLQAPCGGAKNIIEAKARCDAGAPPPTCGGGGGDGGGDGGGGGGGAASFYAKHKTKLLIGGGLLAAYLVLRR